MRGDHVPAKSARNDRDAKRTSRAKPSDEIYEEEGEYDGDVDDEVDDEVDGEDVDDRRPRRAARTNKREKSLSAPVAARAAMQHIVDLTGKEPAGVTSLERSGDGWVIGIEVIEDRRIPSSADVLGLYLTEVDAHGSLVNYRRTRRYSRGSGDSEGA